MCMDSVFLKIELEFLTKWSMSKLNSKQKVMEAKRKPAMLAEDKKANVGMKPKNIFFVVERTLKNYVCFE